MWLTTFAVVFFCFYSSSVVLTEPDNGEPTLQVLPRSSVYDVGAKRAIYCKGKNLPEDIEWTNPKGERIQERDPSNTSKKNNRIRVERAKNNTLQSSVVAVIIEYARLDDSGNWTCSAGSISQVIEVLVGEKVNFTSRYESKDAEEKKNVILECAAKGNPTPIVQWYKDNTPIEPSSKYRIKNDSGVEYNLQINNLNYTDSGEYVCKVTQEALSYYTDKRVQLTVQHGPRLRNSETQDIYPETYRLEEVYVIMNETKNITCSALAHPTPEYNWFNKQNDNEIPIREEETVFTAENAEYSVLMLRLVNESVLGEYVCKVKNKKGSASVVYHVSVGNKPNPPTSVNLVSANLTELTFNVTCDGCKMKDKENKGYAPDPKDLEVLGYSFQFVPAKENYPIPDWDDAIEFYAEISDPEDTLFTVGQLDNSTTYHARVRTRNYAGYSEWVDISPNPATTDNALRLAASIIIVIFACFITRFY